MFPVNESNLSFIQAQSNDNEHEKKKNYPICCSHSTVMGYKYFDKLFYLLRSSMWSIRTLILQLISVMRFVWRVDGLSVTVNFLIVIAQANDGIGKMLNRRLLRLS